jgi:hypothetical protein
MPLLNRHKGRHQRHSGAYDETFHVLLTIGVADVSCETRRSGWVKTVFTTVVIEAALTVKPNY